MDIIGTLVRSIFQKDSLHDCSVEELQTLARQYPYFTPAQFLLAEKLKSTEGNLYKEQLQRLSLHFSNPLWLNYLLNGYNREVPTEAESESLERLPSEQREPDFREPAEPAFTESQPETTDSIADEVDERINAIDRANENGMGQEQEVAHLAAEPTTEQPGLETSSPTGEHISDVAETGFEHGQQMEETEIIPEETSHGSAAEFAAHDEKTTGGTEGATAALHNSEKQPAEKQLTFEPYHTVDYFASQGIKFVSEENPRDRFGQQLKSFTEWLKTMKRLPHAEMAKIADPSADQKVQQLADHSITEEEVVTETMAEVWVKQGNKEKAIETYNKLSLLNPDKSAYFASLTDQLKNS